MLNSEGINPLEQKRFSPPSERLEANMQLKRIVLLTNLNDFVGPVGGDWKCSILATGDNIDIYTPWLMRL